jgi:adenine/guanine phosphoribosyltransferase-like PRPP-binding protein
MSAAAGALATANRRDDAEIAAALARQNRKGFLSIAETEALGREIARSLRTKGGDPDLIVGIANGALLLTKAVAGELKCPFEVVNVRRKGSRLKRRLVQLKQALRIPFVTRGPMALFWRGFERAFYKLWPTELEPASSELAFDVQGKNVFLVDDCVVSGASVRFVHGQLIAAGARAVTVGVICLSDDSPVVPGDAAFPAVVINRLVHFYPWSANHPDRDQYLQWLERHGLKEWD